MADEKLPRELPVLTDEELRGIRVRMGDDYGDLILTCVKVAEVQHAADQLLYDALWEKKRLELKKETAVGEAIKWARKVEELETELAKVRREVDVPLLLRWAKRHHWDSLDKQRDLIIRHLRTFAGGV